MKPLIILLLVCAILFPLLILGLLPCKHLSEWNNPLNWVLFQEPRLPYTRELVTHWVPSPYGSIPVHWSRSSHKTVILYSHGNAENLASAVPFVKHVGETLGADVVTWDYPGYCPFTTFPARHDQSVMNEQHRCIYDFIEPHYDRVLLLGFSLGTGCTFATGAALSSGTHKCGGIITMGAYSSVRQVAQDHIDGFVNLFPVDRWWDSVENIRKCTMPVLLMHGQQDGLIRVKHAKALAHACPHAELVIFPNIGHTTFSYPHVLAKIRRSYF